jgi:hypothetical protein
LETGGGANGAIEEGGLGGGGKGDIDADGVARCEGVVVEAREGVRLGTRVLEKSMILGGRFVLGGGMGGVVTRDENEAVLLDEKIVDDGDPVEDVNDKFDVEAAGSELPLRRSKLELVGMVGNGGDW